MSPLLYPSKCAGCEMAMDVEDLFEGPDGEMRCERCHEAFTDALWEMRHECDD